MSASFCLDEQTKFVSIMSVKPTNVLGFADSMANEIVFYLARWPS
jgi:hypothetical protein